MAYVGSFVRAPLITPDTLSLRSTVMIIGGTLVDDTHFAIVQCSTVRRLVHEIDSIPESYIHELGLALSGVCGQPVPAT